LAAPEKVFGVALGAEPVTGLTGLRARTKLKQTPTGVAACREHRC
jgi:hypothetical protein